MQGVRGWLITLHEPTGFKHSHLVELGGESQNAPQAQYLPGIDPAQSQHGVAGGGILAAIAVSEIHVIAKHVTAGIIANAIPLFERIICRFLSGGPIGYRRNAAERAPKHPNSTGDGEYAPNVSPQ